MQPHILQTICLRKTGEETGQLQNELNDQTEETLEDIESSSLELATQRLKPVDISEYSDNGFEPSKPMREPR